MPTDAGIRFITGYDYRPGWGGLLDRLFLRRLIGWMTAWSFPETTDAPQRLKPVRHERRF